MIFYDRRPGVTDGIIIMHAITDASINVAKLAVSAALQLNGLDLCLK